MREDARKRSWIIYKQKAKEILDEINEDWIVVADYAGEEKIKRYDFSKETEPEMNDKLENETVLELDNNFREPLDEFDMIVEDVAEEEKEKSI